MVELIVDSLEGRDENENATHCVGHVLNDDGLRLRCVIPWLLRGKSGNIKEGSKVVAERFQDGSGLIVAVKSGDWGQVIYGSQIKLGSDSPSDSVALAKKILDNLDKINDSIKAIATHTHAIGTVGGAQVATASPQLTSYAAGLVFGSMASETVKAK